MTVLPFRIITLTVASAALAACAGGHGSAFTAQSMTESQQASHDPQHSLQSGGVTGVRVVANDQTVRVVTVARSRTTAALRAVVRGLR